jgi:hypothetical protein
MIPALPDVTSVKSHSVVMQVVLPMAPKHKSVGKDNSDEVFHISYPLIVIYGPFLKSCGKF